MKKILLFVLMLFSSIMVVDATSISNIDIDIFIDTYGDAIITETWNAYVTEGTEGWHPYYNLGNSVITELEVSMDGKNYTTIGDWDVNASLSDKAYKSGVYYASGNEVDICFGISSYGKHRYVIKYKISNFVSSTKDADILYWNLFPKNFSANPGNVDITIYSDFKYKDTLDVWGYGKYGAPCYVYDGKIEMTSDGNKVKSSEYMTILVKFPKGTFQTDNVLDHDFSYYLEMAEEGAVNYNDKISFSDKVISFIKDITQTSLVNILINFIKNIVLILLFLFSLIFPIFVLVYFVKYDSHLFVKKDFKVRKDVLPFRDIPCNKDIFYAYWVANTYNLVRRKEDFLGAVLLKWIHDGNVKIEKGLSSGLLNNKEVTNIVFVNKPDSENKYEILLYNYMYEASKDGKLEENEFKKWCNTYYKKILGWFNKILKSERERLISLDKIKVIECKKMGILKYNKYVVDSSMMEIAEQMAGLKLFLKEFSIIDEREPIEVSLWNEYLMYAQIFGIANEVARQFNNLYPEIINDMEKYGYNYDDILFIHIVTNTGIRSASSAKSRAESYSSGGGGFSSGGGGGGSFGSGGGGGGFR